MDSFSDALQDYMSQPEAPSQAALARKIGITSAHLHNIRKGRSRGSERIRRRIAEVLDMEYEVMVGGQPLTFVSLRDCPVPRIEITTEMIDQIKETLMQIKRPPYSVSMVPVLTVTTAISGRISSIREDIKGWFLIEGIKSSFLVAIHAEDDRYAPDVPAGGIIIVTLGGFDGVKEGCLYLCGDPAPMAIARVFWQNDGLAVFIPPTGKGMQPYATTQDDAEEIIKGKVLRVYEPKEKGSKNKRKGGIFNPLDYKRK